MSTMTEKQFDRTLAELVSLSLDLRWTWNHASDQLWSGINHDVWKQSANPHLVLQNTSKQRLTQLASETSFLQTLEQVLQERQSYYQRPHWYQLNCAGAPLTKLAFFSMEYGLGQALPFYAGGLGILAADYLKAASDLGLPCVAVGLLFHHGYFRQYLDHQGQQQELYPSFDRAALPLSPVVDQGGETLQVCVPLPGRDITVRVWRAQVGRVALYLLDSSHPENTPTDQAITSQLYPVSTQARFMQQIVLGVAGWRALKALGLCIDICHLNEGHCAFVVLERIDDYMQSHKVSFDEAMLATRAANVFTTHTPVAAAIDIYSEAMANEYLWHYSQSLAIPLQRIVTLGKPQDGPPQSEFSPLYLGLRCSNFINAVSCSHQQVTRRAFQALYPRWPRHEVPVQQVTNGIHVPSWDSPWADQLWTQAAGKQRWLGDLQSLMSAIMQLSDETLWGFKCKERADLVRYVRRRQAATLEQSNAGSDATRAAYAVLDPNVLTLGFARRFTDYKRPNLLLHDQQRLLNILCNERMPVQLIVAGKAHPLDGEGKHLIKQWVDFTHLPAVKQRVVFLSDYDIALAQELVQGVDVWINTPRYPWEACGTSGMKVLVNGGLNLSSRDGWWAQAYQPTLGWGIGDGYEHDGDDGDQLEAEQLYRCLQESVVPEFYRRDVNGLPRQWIARMRASMAELTAHYSSNRMVREYTQRIYLSAAQSYHTRNRQRGQVIKQLHKWQQLLQTHWHEVHWLGRHVTAREAGFDYQLQVHLGAIPTDCIKIQLYAEPDDDQPAQCIELQKHSAIVGALGGYVYHTQVQTSRPAWHYTPRIIAWHKHAAIPNECNKILWWDEPS